MTFKYFAFIFLVLKLTSNVLSSDPTCSSSDKVLIDSSIGTLQGTCQILTIESKKKLYIWQSIPYAEAPVGAKRFKSPEPKSKLSDTYEATKVPNSCMQMIRMKISEKIEFSKPYELAKNSTSRTSEDCLFLNIYAPIDDEFMVKKKAIMIVIHGGDGTVGTGSLDIHEPSVFVSVTDTIVVTFNYRLGILGFLRIDDDDEITGNQGFLDQHLAIKWVHDNAEKFGGDKTRITLLGYGSGARFVALHQIYEPSRALFRNVIIQSGSSVNLADNLLSKSAASKRLTSFFNVVYKDKCDGAGLKECLMEADAFKLIRNSHYYLVNQMSKKSLLTAQKIKALFIPTVDGKVFSESPVKSFRTGNYKKCKMIVGFNANDGASEIPLNYGLITDKTVLKKLSTQLKPNQIINFESFVKFLRKLYAYYPIYPMNRNLKNIHNIIIKSYTNFTMESYRKQSKEQKSNYFWILRTLLTDEEYACPTFKFLDFVADQSEVYTYIYNHRIATSKYPVWYGVVNGDELASVFGQPFRPIDYKRVSYNPWLETENLKYSDDNKRVSKDVMRRWANFIHDDSPNKESDTDSTVWPTYSNDKASKNMHMYLGVIQNGTQIQKMYHSDHCVTWNHAVPKNVYGRL